MPFAVVLFVVFVRDPVVWALAVAAFLVLSMHPIPRMEAAVHSRLNRILFSYFSLRIVYEEKLDGQHLFIAPPHGVLPYGNLLTVHAMRNINGIDCESSQRRGLNQKHVRTRPYRLTPIHIHPNSPGPDY